MPLLSIIFEFDLLGKTYRALVLLWDIEGELVVLDDDVLVSRERREVSNGAESERAEEYGSCPVDYGLAGNVKTSGFFDESLFDEVVDNGRAVNAADILNEALGNRLIIGDYRKSLHTCVREGSILFCFESHAYLRSKFLACTHLIAAVELFDANSAAAAVVALVEELYHRGDSTHVYAACLRETVQLDGLAACEENSFYCAEFFFDFHFLRPSLSISPLKKMSVLSSLMVIRPKRVSSRTARKVATLAERSVTPS